MERSPFLPLPEGMVIGQVEITPTQLTVEVISTQPCANCPGCGNPSEAVHCQYQRTVHDVPCGGRRVVLRLGVRKFFCRTATCQRKVFAERLPDLVQPWARISNRLLEELKAIGLAASAQVSERLARASSILIWRISVNAGALESMQARASSVRSSNVGTMVQNLGSGACVVNGVQNCLPTQGKDHRANRA